MFSPRRLPAIALLLVSAGVMPSCTGKNAVRGDGTAVIHMTPSAFEPASVTVEAGRKVCWVNDDGEARWPASNNHPTHEILSDFDPGLPVRSGEEWCFTFTRAGTWSFHDHLFPELLGTVEVK